MKKVKMGLMAAYVSKNVAPRNVYESLLVKNDKFRKALVNKLLIGSGRLLSVHENAYDALFVDESHRLNAKSGMFHNEGENQIKEIINASRVSVFLLDEKQKITSYDIGSIAEVTTLPPKGRELPESYSQELFLLLRRRAS